MGNLPQSIKDWASLAL